MLERLGLEPALRQLAAGFGNLHPCTLRARISLPAEPLALPAQEVIYRVAQESLTEHRQAFSGDCCKPFAPAGRYEYQAVRFG